MFLYCMNSLIRILKRTIKNFIPFVAYIVLICVVGIVADLISPIPLFHHQDLIVNSVGNGAFFIGIFVLAAGFLALVLYFLYVILQYALVFCGFLKDIIFSRKLVR